MARLGEVCSRLGGVVPTTHTGSGIGHRYRAKLAVRGRVRSPKLGLFQAQSHRIVDLPNCLIHAAPINAAVGDIKSAMKCAQIGPYSEQAQAGVLRYVQLVVERNSGKVQLTLVGAQEGSEALRPLIRQLRDAPWLHSLHTNSQPQPNNVIFGPVFEHHLGPPVVIETLGGASVFFPPGAFGQGNLPLFESLIDQVHRWVGRGRRVLELYCGVGAIGLGLLRHNHVVFNEFSPHGALGLELGLAARPKSERERARLVHGDAAEAAWSLVEEAQDCVIVDPPRKGLSESMTRWLVQSRPRTLIYVACGLDAFLRDAEILCQTGGARLLECQAYGLFPYSEHVEVLAHLSWSEARV